MRTSLIFIFLLRALSCHILLSFVIAFIAVDIPLRLMHTCEPSGLRMVCEPNARMCGWDGEHETIHIQFTLNWNLSVFYANTKRIMHAMWLFTWSTPVLRSYSFLSSLTGYHIGNFMGNIFYLKSFSLGSTELEILEKNWMGGGKMSHSSSSGATEVWELSEVVSHTYRDTFIKSHFPLKMFLNYFLCIYRPAS